MGGVDLVLSRLLDEDNPNLRARQFSLTNAVKCVENTGRAETQVTKEMIRSCSAHLDREIALLDPDILIPQGRHPIRTVISLCQAQVVERFEGTRGSDTITILRAGTRLILATPHGASRMRGFKWRADIMPHFYEQAIETLKQLFTGRSV